MRPCKTNWKITFSRNHEKGDIYEGIRWSGEERDALCGALLSSKVEQRN